MTRYMRRSAGSRGFHPPRPRPYEDHELLILAALLGKFEQAEMMIEAGFGPDQPVQWNRLLELGRQVNIASPEDRRLVFGIDAGVDVEAGWNWLREKSKAGKSAKPGSAKTGRAISI